MQTSAIFLCEKPSNIDWVYGQGRRDELAAITRLHPEVQNLASFEANAELLRETQVIFSTWGMSDLRKEHFDRLPNLKAVFYAAGSVKGFAEKLLDRNIALMSSWAANAVPVAEFSLAQILLATKGYFLNTQSYKNPSSNNFKGRGNFGATVALLGCGQIARKLIEFLKPFELKVMVVDPYLSDREAEGLGVRKVSLEEAFAQAYVVSNHLPNLKELREVIKGQHFASMVDHATFINTGRGAQVHEPEMLEVFQSRPDLTALLDVTSPEPPVEGSLLYKLPNIHLSSHIAGSLGDEVVRMADYAIGDLKKWLKGEPMKYAVTRQMLASMA